MNFSLAAMLLSRLCAVLAVAMLLCTPWSLAQGDLEPAQGLGFSGAIAFLVAGLLARLARGGQDTMRVRDALLVVTLGWLAAGLLGTLPYLFAGERGIPNFADAFFETISGFTTTGSTILTSEAFITLPESLHAWRMMTHWLGGIGIVVIFVALFPQLGVGAKHLFKTEVPGPITEGLRPKIKQTALTLFWIYLALTTVQALLLCLTEMSVFDAIHHAMTTIATGGFSTHPESIAGYDSVAVEIIVTVFMYLAGINFALYFVALSGRGMVIFRDIEWRTYTAIVLVASLIVGALILAQHGDLGTALRKGSFQVLAIVTGTGLASDDYELYPVVVQTLIVALMFCGGMAGSTTGGMKVSRLVIMGKAALNQMAATARPHAVSVVRLGRTAISPEVLKQVFTFAFVFILTALFGSLWLAASGDLDGNGTHDLEDVMTAFSAGITATANVGPGLGGVGPTDNFAHIPTSGKYVLSCCMVLGRLEFFTVLALVLPSTWRRR